MAITAQSVYAIDLRAALLGQQGLFLRQTLAVHVGNAFLLSPPL